jgi:hypothetical protein
MLKKLDFIKKLTPVEILSIGISFTMLPQAVYLSMYRNFCIQLKQNEVATSKKYFRLSVQGLRNEASAYEQSILKK